MPTPSPLPKRPRHLLDPNALGRPRDVEAEKRSLTRVQQWVMSVLAVTTILHLSGGLVLAAHFLPEERGVGAQVGLDVIAGVFGILAVAVGLAIHRRRVVSPWLALGTLPALVGLWLTF